jgi:hypothetical protein
MCGDVITGSVSSARVTVSSMGVLSANRGRREGNTRFEEHSLLECRPDRLWDPPNLLSSPGVKRPVRETDHSPLTSAEDKKTRIYTSTHPYVFMAVAFN